MNTRSLNIPFISLRCATSESHGLHVFNRLSVFLWRQMDTSEFKKIKSIQIQIFSKVKSYRFALKCYKDPLQIGKESAS